MVRLGTVTGKVVVLFREVGLTRGVLAVRLSLSTARLSVAAVRTIPIVGIVLSAATAPIDVFDISHACHHLRWGKESHIIQWIQEQVECLGEKMNIMLDNLPPILCDYEEEPHNKYTCLAGTSDLDKEQCSHEQNDDPEICEQHPCRHMDQTDLCEYDEEPCNRYITTT